MIGPTLSPLMRGLLAAALAVCWGTSALAQQDSVLTFHGRPDRTGNFVIPKLTWERARVLHLDEGFDARVSGHVYAQPLYWHPPGSTSGMVLVATEDNTVYALDGASGREVWKQFLGRPVSRSSLSCGNINPLGVTGTPVIDPSSQTIYLDAASDKPSGPRHLVFGLSLRDGSVLPGWPIDFANALEDGHEVFTARDQNQRGALAIFNDRVYVPFGGHYGDCGRYHGWVVGISLKQPHDVRNWSTRAIGGGIWAPGGVSIVGTSLFVATGNTFGAADWSDGEAVIRLDPDLHRSSDKKDYFAPSDWRELDERDADLGGSNPVALDAPAPNGNQALLLALGKDRKAYLLDRNDLGGIGGSLRSDTVSERLILTSGAAYRVGDDVFVAFQGRGTHCPDPAQGNGLTVLKIHAGSPPSMSTAWCGSLSGAGSPIVTTTDGRADPIVWIAGAEGDDRLHGFRGDTGEPLYSGPTPVMSGLRHFQGLIATENRLYVGADGRIYGFAF